MISVNSPRAILLAARPQTLPGAAVPVMIALSLALADAGADAFRVVPAALCLLFALIMQIDANFVNDYFDFVKGRDDEERLGPKRACAEGWITLPFMRGLIVVTTLLAAAVGLPLVAYGGWTMVAVGAFCIVGCVTYTTHLSRWGMGDAMVLVFFGIIPVCLTYYLQTGGVTLTVAVASIACGIEIDSMLIINNYRDHYQDLAHGKRTLSVLLGRERMLKCFYYIPRVVCLLGLVFFFCGYEAAFFLPVFYNIAHDKVYARMRAIGEGAQLNDVLAQNGRVIMLYGLLVSLGVLVQCL